jgi:hypothetical protein
MAAVTELLFAVICGICNKPLKLETSKIDELGRQFMRAATAQSKFATGYQAVSRQSPDKE